MKKYLFVLFLVFGLTGCMDRVSTEVVLDKAIKEIKEGDEFAFELKSEITFKKEGKEKSDKSEERKEKIKTTYKEQKNPFSIHMKNEYEQSREESEVYLVNDTLFVKESKIDKWEKFEKADEIEKIKESLGLERGIREQEIQALEELKRLEKYIKTKETESSYFLSHHLKSKEEIKSYLEQTELEKELKKYGGNSQLKEIKETIEIDKETFHIKEWKIEMTIEVDKDETVNIKGEINSFNYKKKESMELPGSVIEEIDISEEKKRSFEMLKTAAEKLYETNSIWYAAEIDMYKSETESFYIYSELMETNQPRNGYIYLEDNEGFYEFYYNDEVAYVNEGREPWTYYSLTDLETYPGEIEKEETNILAEQLLETESLIHLMEYKETSDTYTVRIKSKENTKELMGFLQDRGDLTSLKQMVSFSLMEISNFEEEYLIDKKTNQIIEIQTTMNISVGKGKDKFSFVMNSLIHSIDYDTLTKKDFDWVEEVK